MAFITIDSGYIPTNPQGELLVYHTSNVDIVLGADFGIVDTFVATGTSDAFQLSTPHNDILQDTIVAVEDPAEYTTTPERNDLQEEGSIELDIDLGTGFLGFDLTSADFPGANHPTGTGFIEALSFGDVDILALADLDELAYHDTAGDHIGVLRLGFGAEANRDAAATALFQEVPNDGDTALFSITVSPVNDGDQTLENSGITFDGNDTVAFAVNPRRDANITITYDARTAHTHTTTAPTTAEIPIIPGDIIEFSGNNLVRVNTNPALIGWRSTT